MAYTDIFSDSGTSLVAMTTFLPYGGGQNLMVQIELKYSYVQILYENVLYFPGSVIINCYCNPSTKQVSVLSTS